MSTGVDYRSYLLRLWRGADAQWHASLEDSHTGERRAFASVQQLTEYLAQSAQAGFAVIPRDLPARREEDDDD
jgi:hypothetical protein